MSVYIDLIGRPPPERWHPHAAIARVFADGGDRRALYDLMASIAPGTWIYFAAPRPHYCVTAAGATAALQAGAQAVDQFAFEASDWSASGPAVFAPLAALEPWGSA